jgi:hypothetical protein
MSDIAFYRIRFLMLLIACIGVFFPGETLSANKFSYGSHCAKQVRQLKGKDPAAGSATAGFSRRKITPDNRVWLAGYGNRERPPDGKIHDLWVKVMVLKGNNGKQVVMVTTDHMGMSKKVYESIYSQISGKFDVRRSDFMLTFSHNHCGPCITGDLIDYYPADVNQRILVNEYTEWMELQVVDAVGEALGNMQPVRLFMGEGNCSFAVNRRDNVESEVAGLKEKGIPLKGVVDHYVPVLAVRSDNDELLGILFGYACHPTTLSFNSWCGDYPGFAQINLEEKYPGVNAMFFNASGGDQNPLPRRKLELCENYGKMLSDAVEMVLGNTMKPVSSEISSDFSYVNLDYREMVTKDRLLPIADRESSIQERWAKRMIKLLDRGVEFLSFYPYPIQVWSFGNDLLLIGMGGETVVDYSLLFKSKYGEGTWVCGYANEMVAYIPSMRVWEEGGYEGGPHLDEYGHPAWRWSGNTEDRILNAVFRMVKHVRK